MPNKLINKPIILNKYSKTGEIIKKYVFVGDVEPEIKTAFNPIKPNILKKYYGPKWQKILGLTFSGGAEEEITLDELNALTNITQLETQTPSEPQKKEYNDIEFIFTPIYPHDTILDFKKKIYIETGIPIFKQHLWYKYTNKYFNLNYNIFINDKAVNLSIINNVINGSKLEYIQDIPVIMDFFNVKKLLNIKAFDAFSIIEDFTETLKIHEFNIIDLDEFITPLKDNNQIEIVYYGFICLFWPMLTFSAWTDYNNDNQQFSYIYPDLNPDKQILQKIYTAEKNITNEAEDLLHNPKKQKLKKEIEDVIYTSITYSIIQVMSPYTSSIINLRNLFDTIELNDKIISCKCSLLYNGSRLILYKTYKNNEKIKYNIPLKCIILRVKHELTNIDLYLMPDGNYNIKTNWPEENFYNFNDIFKITSSNINPIINMINKMNSTVLNSNAKLDLMTTTNAKFTEIFISMLYRKNIKYYEFKILENILKDYENAGIIAAANQEMNSLEYYFKKGMYKHDADRIYKNFVIDNSYSYLTNPIIKTRWQQLYEFTRNTTITYSHGDIKISIAGIKEKEYNIFYMYILNMFSKIILQKKEYMPEKREIIKQKRNIKTLKTQDPVLYDFKKLYNSPIVYSKICQKPFQPVILNDDEYNALNPEDKKRAVKYWNFTTNTDTYYHCPNSKYPYIQFTVKKHPKDYCIPCCKIKPTTDDDNTARKSIYDTCLTQHFYKKEKTNLITDTRYIMTYGKYIAPGRLCTLPENSIEPLIYESFSAEAQGIDKPCLEKERYYIYGIEQYNQHGINISFIMTVAFSMENSLYQLIETIITLIKKTPEKFKILLNGKINKYFYSHQDLIDNLYDAFLQNKIPSKEDIPWNRIFIDIVYHYLNIISIIFVDNSTHSYENINLLLTSQNSTKDQLNDPTYKYIFLIKKKGHYNPIFLINSIVYFRTRIIDKKLFEHNDNIVNTIKKVIEFTKTSSKDGEKPDITLSTIWDFINSNKKYRITKYFINKNDMCYYIELNDHIYIPIKESPYSNKENIELIFECFLVKKYKPELKDINTFIKEFNHWIAAESEARGFTIIKDTKIPLEQRVNPIYNFIRMDKWLYLDNLYNKGVKAIIGFSCNGINYYHKSISFQQAEKLYKTKFERVFYHPDDINIVLYKSQKAVIDNRARNLTFNMYEYYLYELLLIEYTYLLNKDKNLNLRHLIKKEILKNIDMDSIKTSTNIKSYINEYYNKFKQMEDYSRIEDYEKISKQINDYIINHHNKKMLFSSIDTSFYNFDRIKINSLKTMPREKIYTELMNMAKKIIIISKENNIKKHLRGEFSNMITSCGEENTVYCKANKLMITKEKLKELIDILISDIQNPFKSKWIFNIIFTNQIINYFRFNKHPYEQIYIENHN